MLLKTIEKMTVTCKYIINLDLFFFQGSPKEKQNDPVDRQKFVAARINLQKGRAYKNFTNEVSSYNTITLIVSFFR